MIELDELRELYLRVRRATEALCAPLTVEDQVVQTMPDVSPTKWHLAHTTWFFEELVLRKRPGYRPLDERYRFLFNSYYESVGARQPRPERGHLSRPTLAEVHAYRRWVDHFLEQALSPENAEIVELGIEHEEQHQELILTDAKHVLGENPLEPVYRPAPPRPAAQATPARFLAFDGGVVEIGDAGPGFAFDHERPRHPVLLQPFELADRPVSAGEVLAFIEERGYERPELWLSDGWDACRRLGWRAPAYWRESESGWRLFTLSGVRPIDPAEPACHLSYYEADALARWAGARLPTEAEWEHAAAGRALDGNLLESRALHPLPPGAPAGEPRQLFGDVWEWTASAFSPYPGYRPWPGALGEYNGKFMSGRMVLRGGSCLTPTRHVRASYRNFFPPEARWQLTGARLAR